MIIKFKKFVNENLVIKQLTTSIFFCELIIALVLTLGGSRVMPQTPVVASI